MPIVNSQLSGNSKKKEKKKPYRKFKGQSMNGG